MCSQSILTTEEWSHSAKSVDYDHICDLHICFYSLQSKCGLSHQETQSDFGVSFLCVCVCVGGYMCTLVAKQTQVFGVL